MQSTVVLFVVYNTILEVEAFFYRENILRHILWKPM